ncbi:MAG TPA: hypothetical protein VMT85_24635 [Thermoanaerobaculia bacterium]|nr:hypothetical protein [Thermoanaerobaculia bacterium]
MPFPPVASFARNPSGFVYAGDVVSFTVLSTAELDLEASRVVIQPSYSVARGASVVLRTGSP